MAPWGRAGLVVVALVAVTGSDVPSSPVRGLDVSAAPHLCPNAVSLFINCVSALATLTPSCISPDPIAGRAALTIVHF
ncbi:MAG: hypothetical protein ACPIOQ_48240 [Promethearchaeia archaeon]